MEIKNLIFFCHFGNGDIFESREFVKAWMKKVPAENYFYAHGKTPKILLDIPELKYTEVIPIMNPRKAVDLFDGNLLINTWIGRDSKYVLPGIGCVVEMHYRMHNDMLRETGLTPLRKPIIEYVPKIDYLYYDIGGVMKFIEEHTEKKILISNGPVQSCQAENFDFTTAITKIAEIYPQYAFIITQPTGIDLPNIYYTGNIIGDVGLDLNEISFLSLYCDTIIGRNSGPHVFAQVYDNWMDSNKAILSFTYKEIAATFVLNQPVLMKKYWSSATKTDEVVKEMIRIIERG